MEDGKEIVLDEQGDSQTVVPVQTPATVEDLVEVSDSATGRLSSELREGFDGLSKGLDGVNATLKSIQSSQEQSRAEGGEEVYIVKLAPEQVETIEQYGRIVTTEGLVVCALLALLAGLRLWGIFVSRWYGV